MSDRVSLQMGHMPKLSIYLAYKSISNHVLQRVFAGLPELNYD